MINSSALPVDLFSDNCAAKSQSPQILPKSYFDFDSGFQISLTHEEDRYRVTHTHRAMHVEDGTK